MDSQKPIDYWVMFTGLMERRAALVRQRDEAEVELFKMKQLIVSVFALLPEDKQRANQEAIDDMEAESGGLQDAIKLVFSMHEGDWLTVSNVRDYLIENGFDFRQYKANPLSSISTTLKRIAEAGFVEANPSGSGTLYRRRDPMGAMRRAMARNEGALHRALGIKSPGEQITDLAATRRKYSDSSKK